MNNTEILNDIIMKILLLDEDDISNTLSRKDNEEWDSLTHLVLISECENTFNITLSDDEVADIQTIENLKTSLENHAVSF